ncbi:hypothetical protein CAC42_5798 [Sphaceloma murrayae]|uniref:Uncharacterized protein n=1 Tax=Sphaceloma murrayae TaxID=2082308 RepID=A0A2K1QZ79_9PEZI|nr:hypothetical protein CAC42_5798 [Sphaceloma murrayae]
MALMKHIKRILEQCKKMTKKLRGKQREQSEVYTRRTPQPSISLDYFAMAPPGDPIEDYVRPDFIRLRSTASPVVNTIKTKRLELMDMADEILLLIVESHGCESQKDDIFDATVDLAQKHDLIEEDAVILHRSPADLDPALQPIAQVCQRLRQLFLKSHKKPNLSHVFIPIPERIPLPLPASFLKNVKTVSMAPFLALETNDTLLECLTTKADNDFERRLSKYCWVRTLALCAALPDNIDITFAVNHIAQGSPTTVWLMESTADVGGAFYGIHRSRPDLPTDAPPRTNVGTVDVHMTEFAPSQIRSVLGILRDVIRTLDRALMRQAAGLVAGLRRIRNEGWEAVVARGETVVDFLTPAAQGRALNVFDDDGRVLVHVIRRERARVSEVTAVDEGYMLRREERRPGHVVECERLKKGDFVRSSGRNMAEMTGEVDGDDSDWETESSDDEIDDGNDDGDDNDDDDINDLGVGENRTGQANEDETGLGWLYGED